MIKGVLYTTNKQDGYLSSSEGSRKYSKKWDFVSLHLSDREGSLLVESLNAQIGFSFSLFYAMFPMFFCESQRTRFCSQFITIALKKANIVDTSISSMTPPSELYSILTKDTREQTRVNTHKPPKPKQNKQQKTQSKIHFVVTPHMEFGSQPTQQFEFFD